MAISRKKPRFSIGLTVELYEWVKKQAEKEGRSMAGAVNKIIRQAKEAERQQQAA
jgi:hypothetical protein